MLLWKVPGTNSGSLFHFFQANTENIAVLFPCAEIHNRVLLRTGDSPGSDPGPETGHPDSSFSLLSQSFAGKYQGCNSNYITTASYTSFPIRYQQ